MAVPRRQVPLAVRILITVLLLALYALGDQVPLPFVALPAGATVPRWASLTALGIEPLVWGFGLTAALGLLLDVLLLGARRRFSRLALPASFAVASVQAAQLVIRLEGESPTAGPHLPAPGWAARLGIVATLVAVTAAIDLLGNALTAWGVANGFCLFFLVSVANRLNAFLERPPAGSSVGWTFVFLALGALLAGGYLRTERPAAVAVAEGEAVDLPLPPFPQSILPLLAAYWLFQTLARAGRLPRFLIQAPSAQILVLALLVVAFGLLAFALAGRPRRFLADLPPGVELLPAAARPDPFTLQLLLGTAFLVGGIAFYAVANRYAGVQAALLPLPFLLPLVALGLDLVDALRFFRRHRAVTLATFDDGALAAYWQSRLTARGIPVLSTAHHFRGLYSRFLPLVTIDLRVPVERLDEAQALLAAPPPAPAADPPPEDAPTADRSPDS